MLIDLHAHTSHSDGTDTPAGLVDAAVAAGLDVVALTDHDVMTGWAEAGARAEEVGLTVVPGVEISCRHRGVSIHLLAYLPDPTHRGLLAELEASREARLGRMEAMVDRLARAGFPLTYADVVAQAEEGATLGRPHLADALVAAGVFPNRAAAFAEVLHDSSPYYVGHYAPDPVQAVRLVREAGGVAVMAHPFASARGRTVTDEVVVTMIGAGLEAERVEDLGETGRSGGSGGRDSGRRGGGRRGEAPGRRGESGRGDGGRGEGRTPVARTETGRGEGTPGRRRRRRSGGSADRAAAPAAD